jgi:hypothetical protein
LAEANAKRAGAGKKFVAPSAAPGVLDKWTQLGCCLGVYFRTVAAVIAAQTDGQDSCWAAVTGHNNGQQNVWGNVSLIASKSA